MLPLFYIPECDTRCSGCKGPGASNCLTCADGYKDEEGTCTGITFHLGIAWMAVTGFFNLSYARGYVSNCRQCIHQ